MYQRENMSIDEVYYSTGIESDNKQIAKATLIDPKGEKKSDKEQIYKCQSKAVSVLNLEAWRGLKTKR